MKDSPVNIAPQNHLGIAADHGGFELKKSLIPWLREKGYEVTDYGNKDYKADDDYPDYILPLAHALRAGDISRGIAVCGSGVGASIAANKVTSIRACLIHDSFSAHQGVEDDDMNLLCLGGRVVGHSYARELISVFLSAKFTGAERHRRRLEKVKAIESLQGA
jgi:ribose 5-phosphate isomerase B